MAICILIIQGLVEILGVAAFVFGYFTDMWWSMIAGGAVMVLEDISNMLLGFLNPLFPILFAVALAIIMDPWYVGIFVARVFSVSEYTYSSLQDIYAT